MGKPSRLSVFILEAQYRKVHIKNKMLYAQKSLLLPKGFIYFVYVL